MKKLFTVITLFSLLATTTWATNTPQPMKEIETFLTKQSQPVTAHDIAAHFSPSAPEGITKTAATNATTFGTANKFAAVPAWGGNYLHVVALSSTDFVVTYMDWDDSRHGKAVVGQVSGGTITYGSTVVFNNGSTSGHCTVALSSTDFVVAYYDTGGGTYNGNAIVGQVSGTTITFGAETNFRPSGVSSLAITALSSTDFVIAYSGGNAIVGQASGTTLTFGSEVTFHNTTIYEPSITALNSTDFVIAYTISGGFHGYAVAGQVSGGTTITFGSPSSYNGGDSRRLSVAALSSTSFVISYRDAGNSHRGTVRVGQMSSGTTFTLGSEYVYNSGITNIYSRGVIALSSTKIVIIFRDAGDSDKGKTIIGTISGTTASFGTEEQFAAHADYPTGGILRNNLIGPPTGLTTKYIIAYPDENDSQHGYARTADASFFLPVDLTKFVGEATDKGTLLAWQTASERNNEGFDIERSTDGENWETIDFVQGFGTTQEVQDYTYLDETPVNGINYYRLKQVDFDGQFEYSDVVSITVTSLKSSTTRIFPNPVQDALTIIGGQGQAIIYNALGQPVRELIISNEQLIMNTSDLPKGQYVLQVTKEDGSVVTERFVKQ